MTPDAVPESSMFTHAVLPSATFMIPPLDLVTIGGAVMPRSRSAVSSEPR